MKENYKCERYLHIFLKLPQAEFKLDHSINKLIDNYVDLFVAICREEQDIFLWIFYFFWLSWSYFFLQNNRPYNSTVACSKGVIKALRVV